MFSVDAGWSSLVARRAHNPKVVGSNPAPATTNYIKLLFKGPDGPFLIMEFKRTSCPFFVPRRLENDY